MKYLVLSVSWYLARLSYVVWIPLSFHSAWIDEPSFSSISSSPMS